MTLANPTFSGTTTFPGSTTINSSGSVGIANTNPQSALDVTGAIRVSGGITTTYSTLPTFTSGQVGYVYYQPATNSSSTSSYPSSSPLVTITNVSPGVYIANACIVLNVLPAGSLISTQIFYNNTASNTPSIYFTSASSQGNYNSAPFSFTIVQTTTSSVLLCVPTNQGTLQPGAYLQLTRIA